MNRGFINAKQAANSFNKNSIVHSEISAIESVILNFANNGYREITIDFTITTDSNIPSFKQIIDLDLDNETLVSIGHGFSDGATIIFESTEELPEPLLEKTEYYVCVIDDDTFKIYTNIINPTDYVNITSLGDGIITCRSVLESEKYFAAWKTFYVYPRAESYLSVLTSVENHFRGLGYVIERAAHPNTKTFVWKIKW
jgi:hypothetical protein